MDKSILRRLKAVENRPRRFVYISIFIDGHTITTTQTSTKILEAALGTPCLNRRIEDFA